MTLVDTLDWATKWVKAGRRGYLCTVNVAMLMMMRTDPRLQQFADGASLSVADGQPLVWVSQLKRVRLPERVTGVDLLFLLCERAAKEGLKIYLLGARSEVVEMAAEKLRERYEGLCISGFSDGYFTPEEAPDRARTIRESGAQILWLGMGVPRQEYFVAEHWQDLGVNLAIPVGGSFEVVAGRKKRAPVFLQKIGMEWCYRLCMEPRRLGKRYFTTNTQFFWLMLKDILARH